jgi:hypothetical protein
MTRTAELLHSEFRLYPSIAPTRGIDSGDTVSARDAADPIADGDHFPGTVAQRDDALNRWKRVLLAEDKQVPIAERSCMNTYDGVVHAGYGRRIILVKHDPIHASKLVEVVRPHDAPFVDRIIGAR